MYIYIYLYIYILNVCIYTYIYIYILAASGVSAPQRFFPSTIVYNYLSVVIETVETGTAKKIAIQEGPGRFQEG